MKRFNKNITLVLACLSFLLLGAAGSLAAVNVDVETVTPPVVTGRQLMQEKIDALMVTLQERLAQLREADRPALFLGSDFSRVSGLDRLEEEMLNPNHPLYDVVRKAGRLHQDAQTRPALADDANLYLNLAILGALDALLQEPSLADNVKNTLYAMIDLLKELELPEAYQVPDTRFGFTGLGRPDDRDRTDREIVSEGDPTPVPGIGFNYYGKPYDLDSDVTVDDRGFIVFADGPVDTSGINFDTVNTDNNMPAMLGPLVSLPDSSVVVRSGGAVEKTDLRYTYRWDVVDRGSEVAKAMDTSASLYRNDWIVFDYHSQTPDNANFAFAGLAGLSPGDGSAGSGHPGEGQDRNWWTGSDFVQDTLGSGQSSLDFDGSDYTAVHNYPIEGPRPYVVADTFFIFRPYEWTDSGTYSETPNKYMVTAGTRSILAGALSSLDEAIGYVTDDPQRLQDIDNGEFFADILQADGAPYPIVGSELNLIKNDGFLAYAVQVEEDIVNRKILEMHQDAVAAGRINTLMDNINTAKGYSNIRERDAWLARQSDAQAGRVLRDQNGNWVRVQQYVLRPDNNTVQILSASLRDVAGKQELSTLDFTTSFRDGDIPVPSDLTELPWDLWLDTRTETESNFKYVLSPVFDPLVERMSVTIKNPHEQSFQETRTFAEKAMSGIKLYVTNETLNVSGIGAIENNYYFESLRPQSAEINYSVIPAPDGFKYRFNGQDQINVSLYQLSGNTFSRGGETYTDIWDALRVNERGAKNIGEDSLEIIIGDDTNADRFNDFDVVYIPMSRMLWKDKTGEHNIVIPPDSEV